MMERERRAFSEIITLGSKHCFLYLPLPSPYSIFTRGDPLIENSEHIFKMWPHEVELVHTYYTSSPCTISTTINIPPSTDLYVLPGKGFSLSPPQNLKAILIENREVYMINPCSANISFVVELCETFSVRSLVVGCLELFSSFHTKELQDLIGEGVVSREWVWFVLTALL